MLLNYKFEIYPTEEQQHTLVRWINICRQQYNSAILDKQRYYKQHKKDFTRSELQKQQTIDKKTYYFLKEVPSQPLQEVFARLEKAYKRFFKKEGGYPKIKSFKEYRSITLTQFGMFKYKSKDGSFGTGRRMCSLTKGGKLLISKLGVIDIKWHRKLDGRVKQVVIKHQGNRWFATFCVEKHVNQGSICDANKTIGIDVGIHKFAVLSNGEEIKSPTFLRKEERKLKHAQRKLPKMKKGSKNWYKQVAKVQQIHTKIANQRKDFLHKISFRLTNTYGVICVEDLKIKNMVRNRHLAKSIHDAGWGMFRNFLSYKAEQNGGRLVLVKPHYTSQNCSKCEKTVKKSLSVRTHVCKHCGTILDRDHNAAINIEKAGLVQIAHQPAS
ncbi:RNA-guided endonuclease InsQ/TnpB family protein [Bacillus cereus]|uniref:RNA-guided endonuclease InsQ/TnpB family protein n=1 Tax=Bacillus cereus TaxID=1396 RepID=UPI000B4B969E|nr:RNA-guided endonuclease TnpB family protein [Bacillus cereus]